MESRGHGGMPDDFEPYRFLKVLGSGGLGTVYQVEDTRMGRLAVMKVGSSDLDATAKERFQREAITLGLLNHFWQPIGWMARFWPTCFRPNSAFDEGRALAGPRRGR